MTDAEDKVDVEALSRALERTSRKALNAKEVPPEALRDPVLARLAARALSESLGPSRTGAESFQLTIWQGGARHTGLPIWILNGVLVPEGTPGAAKRENPGAIFSGPLDVFVKVLRKRAELVVPKKHGWVVEPTTNPSGVRTNAATLAMHAVFLDCDDRGSWDETLSALRSIGLAHVAYQSSGYRPSNPKWRVVLPLAAPHPVRDDRERAAWKKLYHRVRVLVGALGGLDGEGFDPRTDAPSVPWFTTERRATEDTPREVVFSPGSSLDHVSLAMSLPVVEDPDEDEERKERPKRSSSGVGEPMDDARMDEIVAALTAVTSAVPSGRRDLYLALPGALLDRGVQTDDALLICTEVSLAYPRRHAEKHADNVHGAKTTIAKFLAGDSTYTRIGTLQGAFPDVAAVLDRLVPDPVEQAIRDMMVEGAAIHSDVTETVSFPTPPPPPIAPDNRPRAQLRKKLERLAEEKTAASADDPNLDAKTRRRLKNDAQAGSVLARVLDRGFDAFLDVRVRELAAKEVFSLVGFDLDATFDEVVAVIGEVSTEIYKVGATAFAAARERRAKWDAAAPEREARRVAEKRDRQERALRFHRTGRP